MAKIMLDTQIYDCIVSEPGLAERLNLLSKAGKLEILTTHIQQDEIAAITDEPKRTTAQQIMARCVPTSGAIWGVSKWDMCTWGDGSAGGFGIDEVRSPSKGHTADALIATTAAKDADVLVTEDGRLTKRLKTLNSQCKIWGYTRFRAYILELAT